MSETFIVRIGKVSREAPYSRLVLSQKILSRAGLSPGDYVEVSARPGELIVRKVKVTPE